MSSEVTTTGSPLAYTGIEVIPTSTFTPFAYVASQLPASAAILRHRRGKFPTGDGELPKGTRMAVHSIAFGWLRFNGAGNPPTRIVASPDHPKPIRAALPDQDERLWGLGPDGKTPSDPWVEFCEATVTRLDNGVQYALSATAPTARSAIATLARQIVWGQRHHGLDAVPVIELQSREVSGQYGLFDVPEYPIVDWIAGNTSGAQSPISVRESTPSSVSKGLKRAQRALQQRLADTPKDELDDEIPY